MPTSSSRSVKPAPAETGLVLPLIGNIETVFGDIGCSGAGVRPPVVIRPGDLDGDLLEVSPGTDRSSDRPRAAEIFDQILEIRIGVVRGRVATRDSKGAIGKSGRNGRGRPSRQIAHPHPSQLSVDDLQCDRLLARGFQHLRTGYKNLNRSNDTREHNGSRQHHLNEGEGFCGTMCGKFHGGWLGFRPQ